MPRKFGLIGKKLSHSFSKSYFEKKFEDERIEGCSYELFEIAGIEEFSQLLKEKDLIGLNVTIPYKGEVMTYLNEIDEKAARIGAVNVISIRQGRIKGYNSDYLGFRQSLENWVDRKLIIRALVLGSGGASKAVVTALEDLDIDYQIVSRKENTGFVSYVELDAQTITSSQLIINTTPLGMYPDTHSKPDIPYRYLTNKHCLYDLVYNPEETGFMTEGIKAGAQVKNGLEMLHLQAEKSWEIWNSSSD